METPETKSLKRKSGITSPNYPSSKSIKSEEDDKTQLDEISLDHRETFNECDICSENIINYNLTDCCGRNGCKECQIKNIEYNLMDSKCIYCFVKIPLKVSLNLLNEVNSPKFNILKEKTSKGIIIKCYSCSFLFDRPSINELDERHFIQCPKCNESCCFFCCGKYGKCDCGNLEIILETSPNMKSCISCKNIVEKIGGCDHIQCGYCGFEFCWICSENWESNHPMQKCKTVLHSGKFKDMQEWGSYYVQRTKKFILQSSQWKFFVNGLTSIANLFREFLISNNEKRVYWEPTITYRLIKTFGLRYREFPLENPKHIDFNVLVQSLTSFFNLYFKQCVIFYIVYELLNHKNDAKWSVEQRENWKVLINDIIVRDEIRGILKNEQSIIYSFITFLRNFKPSTFRSFDIENWLKENLIPYFAKTDTSMKFLPYIWVYNSDYSIENLFIQSQTPILQVVTNNEDNNNTPINLVFQKIAPISSPPEDIKSKIFLIS